MPVDSALARRQHDAYRAALAGAGCAPVVVDIGGYEKLEGCVTCLSVLVPG